MEGFKDPSDSMSDGASSQSSRISAVDEETLKMGTEPIKYLILRSYSVFFISNFIPQVIRCVEFSLSIRQLGLEAATLLMLLLPICDLMVTHVLAAMADASAQYISRNIAKNQVIIANTYLAHFFLMAIVWVIICFIIFFSVLQNLFNEPMLGSYLVLRCAVMAIPQLLTYSVFSFLKAENRYFLLMTECIMEALIFILVITFLYQNDAVKHNLTAAGVAHIVSGGVCSIWFIFVMFKLNFAEVTYRGALRFNFKRLSPIRPKFMLQILSMTVPQLLSRAADSIMLLECVLLIKLRFKQPDFILKESISLIVFTRIKGLLSSLIKGFDDLFIQLASYNIGIKKTTRVYETFKYTILFQLIIFPIIAIFTGVAPLMVKILIPLTKANDTPMNQFILRECEESAMEGAWVAFLMSVFPIAMQVFFFEGQNLYASLIQLPQIIYALLFLYFSTTINGENAPFTSILASSELLSLIIGICCVISQFTRYYRLNKLNAMRTVKSNVNDPAQSDLVNTEIRSIVLSDINRPVENEEIEKQRMKVSGLNAMFNKTVALRSSRAFQNFKESVYRNSESQRGSVARESGAFYIRASGDLGNPRASGNQ